MLKPNNLGLWSAEETASDDLLSVGSFGLRRTEQAEQAEYVLTMRPGICADSPMLRNCRACKLPQLVGRTERCDPPRPTGYRSRVVQRPQTDPDGPHQACVSRSGRSRRSSRYPARHTGDWRWANWGMSSPPGPAFPKVCEKKRTVAWYVRSRASGVFVSCGSFCLDGPGAVRSRGSQERVADLLA